MINITQRSYSYLHVQNGELSATDTYVNWIGRYMDKLRHQFEQLLMVAPFPKRVLDIGSGLGGIDVLLIRHFACQVTMVDGECSSPVVVRQDVPFCSRQAVDSFMADNHIDVQSYNYCSPDDLEPGPFDLVFSFASWCFHYPPSFYLDYVYENTKSGSMIMLDVRKEREWKNQLKGKFLWVAELEHGRKWDRCVFERR